MFTVTSSNENLISDMQNYGWILSGWIISGVAVPGINQALTQIIK